VLPIWLTTIAWVYLSVCFICAGILSYDIFANQRRQPMGVMDAVFRSPHCISVHLRWPSIGGGLGHPVE
jgi:hypothetical protein